jgi:poly-gamma-glutamate capsule biosynthesis protein CapA/YwtB (metallophosphatase superfamily)
MRHSRVFAALPAALVTALLAALAAGAGTSAPTSSTVRLLFGGDVMLGRGVAKATSAEPESALAGIRIQVEAADLAVANLESPLTTRPHLARFGPNALEARPSAARLLADAGFDAMAIANNHAGDAGPLTVPDTMHALSEHGLAVVGAGSSAAAAFRPLIVRSHGLVIALLSFDATGQGPRARAQAAGVAWWDERRARAAVARARAEADLVVVGVHGGAEYVPEADPYILRIDRELAAWGADVVWGSGPHVVQPVRVVRHGARSTVLATSLGNLLFDQHIPGTQRGALLEVTAGGGGVRAYRVGRTAIADGRVAFRAWHRPSGDAVVLDDAWWSLSGGTVRPVAQRHRRGIPGFDGVVVDAALGDPEGNGQADLVVSFRRRFRPTNVSGLVTRSRLVDSHGRAAHVGLYRPRDLRPRWVAGTMLRPVVRLAPCDGSLAVAYSTLADARVVATGAWHWSGFGFTELPALPGQGIPGCADVDGDGRLDPVVVGRRSR